MKLSPRHAAVLLALAAGATAAVHSIRAQPQNQPPAQPSPAPVSNLILLDPAHGASDNGARIGDNAEEKDVTLALAARLHAALNAAGFVVIATRDSDPSDPITTDQRAEIANRTHALACIVLHATAAGSGIHVYISTLQPPPDSDPNDAPDSFVPTPWEMAQAKFIPQSQTLASSLTTAFSKNQLPALSGVAPVRPLDNLMCPAVAIELAPLPASGSPPTPASDPAYQQQVATTLANALRIWRDRNHPAPPAPSLDSQIAAQSRAIAAAKAAEVHPVIPPQKATP